MNVTLTQPAEIALDSLSSEERRRVHSWLGYFERWDEDPFVREKSKKLPEEDDVYYFNTSDDIAIFFRLDGDSISILDLARPSWLSKFSRWFGLAKT